MRKLLVCLGLGLAFMTAPALAAVNLGLPINTEVNFDGNGVFSQVPIGTFDGLGPNKAALGTELFGAGTISDVSLKDDPGVHLWWPTLVGPDFEMTFVFWDAVVSGSNRVFVDTDGDTVNDTIFLTAQYNNGPARILLVQDMTADYTGGAGPGGFDLVDGEFPTAYTLEDAGYDSDGAPDAASMFPVADDAGEEVFLDLELYNNSSTLEWDMIAGGFTKGSFLSNNVEIIGGSGASQFSDFIGYDGSAGALILDFQPAFGWAFSGDVDITLTTVPEPATLIFLGTGLVSLLGYGIRRRMS